MSVELYNGWYVATPYSDIGKSSGTSSTYQKYNAQKIYDIFIAEGWSVNAIAAMLGNMNYESNLNPARVYPVGSFPHQGASLSDIGNDQAVYHPDSAYGFVQWKGRGELDPDNNQLVGYAIRYNTEWYDGDIQMQRLLWEYHDNKKFHPRTINGVYWTWDKFVTSTEPPETLAMVWMHCYEGTDSVRSIRKQNARKWYEYFEGGPEPPGPDPQPPEPEPEPDPEPDPPPDPEWIWGVDFAQYALSLDPAVTGVQIPYSQMDCIQFCDYVWNMISVVAENGWTLGPGTNSLWRSTATFDTSTPRDPPQYPTPILWWKGTIAEYMAAYNTIPTGCFLFHRIPEDGNPPIPPQYAGDGIGNFVHMGIYCGEGIVMQSGGKDSGSIPGGGVHRSSYSSAAWNYLAFPCWVDPTREGYPGPTSVDLVTLLSMWYSTRKKGVYKRVKRTI